MTNAEVIQHAANLERLKTIRDGLEAEKKVLEKKLSAVGPLVYAAERVREVFEGVALGVRFTKFEVDEGAEVFAVGDDIKRAASVERNACSWTKEPKFELTIRTTAGYHRRTRFKFDGFAAALKAAKVFVATGKDPDEVAAPLPLATLEALMAALPPDSPLRGDVYSLRERYYPWL